MRKLLIIGILAVANIIACSGPMDSTPEDRVVLSEDFESGVLPNWGYNYCVPSIENDGDNYLLLTVEPEMDCFFLRDRLGAGAPARKVEAFTVSFAYKTAGISYGAVYVTGENFIGQDFEPSPGWRKVKFCSAKAALPSLFFMGLTAFGSYRPGVTLAVDDIKITAVYEVN